MCTKQRRPLCSSPTRDSRDDGGHAPPTAAGSKCALPRRIAELPKAFSRPICAVFPACLLYALGAGMPLFFVPRMALPIVALSSVKSCGK